MYKVTVHHHGRRAFKRYTVYGEELVFTTHKHWVTLLEPALTALLSLPVAIWATVSLAADVALAGLFLVLWLALVARFAYAVVEWRDTWFASTTRRLLYQHGLFTREVAMMPLEKVTDMKYSRSTWGLLLGYGSFVMESAGQDQALRSITFVPHPDVHYRALVAALFGTKGVTPPPEDEPEEELELEPYTGFHDKNTGGVVAYPVDEWDDPWADSNPPSYAPSGPALRDDAPTQMIDLSQIDDLRDSPVSDETTEPEGAERPV